MPLIAMLPVLGLFILAGLLVGATKAAYDNASRGWTIILGLLAAAAVAAALILLILTQQPTG